jgi:hypothetical protein
MAARTPWANPESTWRIYSALATAAGVSRPMRVDDPRVLAGRIRTGGRELLLLVNWSSDALALEPGTDADTPGAWPLRLEPHGVATLDLPPDQSHETTLTVATLTKGVMPASDLRMTR